MLHRNINAATPLSGNLAGAVSPRAAPATFLPHGTRPMCEACGRGFYGCICDMPEPEPEHFKPGLNRDPDTGWALAERSAYGMPGVGK
jgi:hypothetical protein